ncbi:septation protein A [Kistimonas asteriae]|uniref:septation protein A n=1 Tax=Kistimonas asteriae TaxID=517724 RepID=UPI001BA6FAED|nr:septation protein A [Kistimonas asteriae]
MKQFIDFLPLLIFFIVYKIDPRPVSLAGHEFEFGGIFSATMMLIVATVIVYGLLYLKQKSLEKSQLITLVAVLLFGSLTLAFHEEAYLKWKAPIVNWIFGLAFLASQFIGQKPLIRRMLDHAMSLPDAIWTRLNTSWAIFFILLGAANLYVAFTFETIWVDFKVFGSLGLTFAFVIIQFLFLARYIKQEDTDKTT